MSNASDTSPPLQAVEQLPIPLFDGVILAARTGDGLIHLSLRDLCMTVGLDTASQRRRIQANESLHLTPIRAFVDRQFRTLDFLLLDDLSLWILTIRTSRVNAEAQTRVTYIKQYLEASVRNAFAQLSGLPETSRQIEDLRDLDRIDRAFQAFAELNERQTTIEASQDRARSAFRDLQTLVRDLQTRVQALEQQSKLRISSAQRGTIYQLVQTWGAVLAMHRPEMQRGEAIRSCWRMLNQRFTIGTYTDLPAARYDEAIQFVKAQYRGLTGQEIDAAEQANLELE
jgi:P22_AR N-terminal domain/ORF6C domain